MGELENKLGEYRAQIDLILQKCTKAETAVIQAETTLTHLTEEREKIIKECEELAGVPIDEVQNFLSKELADIESTMQILNDAMTAPSQENIQKLEDIVNSINQNQKG